MMMSSLRSLPQRVLSLARSATISSGAANITRRPSRLPSCSAWFSTSSGGSSDSITYSGGQASVGQGGFYGSGGARALTPDQVEKQQTNERNKMLALAHDVENVRSVMQELETLESLLRGEDGVSSKRIELKNSIKKLMTAPDFLESLNNLELQGEPVWGLSCEERELIIMAREKVNEC